MFNRKTLSVIMTCSMALTVACSKKQERVNTATVNSTAIVNDKKLTPAQKSEKLALAAEQLLSPGSFMYADEVASVALSLNKNNKRAQMVSALVAPMMATKGIMERIKPLTLKDEEAQVRYAEAMEKLESQPSHALKKFVLDGQQDIKNEKDIQGFNDSIRNAFNKQRMFFKANKDLNMTFNIADLFAAAQLNDEDTCYWEETQDGNYEEYCYEDKKPKIFQYKLNRADNEALQQIASGMMVYATLLNSYSASGAIDVAIANKDNETQDDNKIREELMQDPSFGTLRDKGGLALVTQMGLDGIAGYRWAKASQNEVCATGDADSVNRPGYVFSKGICINKQDAKETDKVLALVEMALKGEVLKQTFKGENGDYTTRIKPGSVLAGSVKDVRQLGLTFNECGKVVGAKDQSLGGTLPNNDAVEVLSLSNHQCRN